jgi:hypothetical protein
MAHVMAEEFTWDDTEVGTVEWVRECANVSLLLINTLRDIQNGRSLYAVLDAEGKRDHSRIVITHWMQSVGTQMWPDMTHFQVGGMEVVLPEFTEGGPCMYDQGDIVKWRLLAKDDPERLADLWNNGINREVWSIVELL